MDPLSYTFCLNPLSSEFKASEKVFHEELSGPQKAAVVIASFVGAFFFIIGAFPVFCWMVKALQPDENSVVSKVNKEALKEFGTKDSTLTKTSSTKRSNTNQLDVNVLVFGKEYWEQHFGNIGEVPDFPTNINEILQEDYLFVEGKKVWETHDLFLIPDQINGKDFTLGNLAEILSTAGSKENIEINFVSFAAEDPDKKASSHWLLVTKEEIPIPAWKEGGNGNRLMHLHNIRKDFEDKKLHYDILELLDLAPVLFLRLLHLRKQGKLDSILDKKYGSTTNYKLAFGNFFAVHIRKEKSTIQFNLGAASPTGRGASYSHVLGSRIF